MWKFIVQIVFPLQIVFFGNKIVYEVLSSCGVSRTCNEYIAIINIFLASCMILSFSTVSTPMPPSSAFLYYTTIFVKSITPYCGSVQASNLRAPPPPYTASIPHHHTLVSVLLTIHRGFPLKEALYFETCQIKLNKIKEINRYTKIQV